MSGIKKNEDKKNFAYQVWKSRKIICLAKDYEL